VKPFKEADPTPTDDEDNLGTIPELPSTEATKDE
jgi:hypothetical protein